MAIVVFATASTAAGTSRADSPSPKLGFVSRENLGRTANAELDSSDNIVRRRVAELLGADSVDLPGARAAEFVMQEAGSRMSRAMRHEN